MPKQVACLVTDEEMTGYDRLSVWRHVEGLPSVKLTAAAAQPAATSLVEDVTPASLTFEVVGKQLGVYVNGRLKSVTFTGTDPLSAEEVLDQINAGITGVRAFIYRNLVELSTTLVGPDQSLEIVNDGAAPKLGMWSDAVYFGKAEAPSLQPGTNTYTVTDPWGYEGEQAVEYSYVLWSSSNPRDTKPSARFRNAPTGYVLGTAQFFRSPGVPHVGLRVLAERIPSYGSQVLETTSYETCITDTSGKILVAWSKGTRGRIRVPSEMSAHLFQVPSNVAQFDMLASEHGLENDAFTVQRPSFDPPVRSS